MNRVQFIAGLLLASGLAVPALAQDNAAPQPLYNGNTVVQPSGTIVQPSGTGPGGAHTIDWYKRNEDARKTVIKRCDNDPGELQNDPDCINAKKADNEAGVDDFKKGVDHTIDGASHFIQNLGN